MANGVGLFGPALQAFGSSLMSGGDLTQTGRFLPAFQQQAANRQTQALTARRQQALLDEQERKRSQEEASLAAFQALPAGLFGSEEGRAAFGASPQSRQAFLLQRAKSLLPAQAAPETPGQRATRELAEARTKKVRAETPTTKPEFAIADPVKRANVESRIRGDFTKASARFNAQQTANDRLMSLVNLPDEQLKTGAQDLALTYAFMQTIEPGLAVQQGEFANVDNARGVSSRVRNLYNSIVRGKRLTPAERQEFLRVAQASAKKELTKHNRRIKRFTGIARRSGVDPRNVVTGAIPPVPGAVPPGVPVAGAAPGSAAAASPQRTQTGIPWRIEPPR